MKRAPSHKQWYLSRLIFFAALFGYSVVVLLLIVLNGFLIMNCQQHFVQVQQELVQDELHQVSNSLDILRTTVMNIGMRMRTLLVWESIIRRKTCFPIAMS